MKINLNEPKIGELYLNGKSTPKLAKENNCSANCIIECLKRNNIERRSAGFQKQNKQKGMTGKHHTNESIEKIKKKLIIGYKNGRNPWNKNLTAETDERIKQCAEKRIGRIVSEETGKKISMSNKGKIPHNKGQRTPRELVENHRRVMLKKYANGELVPWNKKKTKKDFPQLSNSGVKKGNKPWNTGLKAETDERVKKNTDCLKKANKKLWANPEYKIKQLKKLHNQPKPTKPERELINIIQKNNLPFNYIGTGKIWFKGENHSFNPDFLSMNPKHIIEVFGTYWHNIPEVMERDKERILTYQKYGYKTLVIWEHELVPRFRFQTPLSEQEIVSKINNFLSC